MKPLTVAQIAAATATTEIDRITQAILEETLPWTALKPNSPLRESIRKGVAKALQS